MFHETFLTSTFRDDDLLNASTLRPDDSRSLNVHDRRVAHKKGTYQVLIDIQAIHHEKFTLEARKVTKLLRRDTTSSSDDLPSYAQSIKLISTTSTTLLVNNDTQDLYSEGATLSKFIYEGRPTTTKPTFVALPYLTSYSTFHECLRGTPCQPQASLHKHLTKPVVIISYSIRLERKIMLLSTSITCWNTTVESTQKKSIYSTSKNPMTFQVGIHSSNSLYVEIIYINLSPDPDIFVPYVYSDPSDETIRRLYGIPSKENYISDH